MILTAPKNLRLYSTAANVINVTWDRIPGEDDSVLYRVSAMLAGAWMVLSETKSNIIAITSEYTAVKVTALSGADESGESNILPVNPDNIAAPGMSSAVGMDEAGKLRYIATTPEGIVKVTGATITNYGGDSSAANQLISISAINTLNASVAANTSKLNTVISGLDSVSLSSGTISALTTVSVGNLPVNYPDAATTAAINSLASAVAKDSSLSNINTSVSELVKSSDLNLDGSKNLSVIATNLPSDYPDSAAGASLSAIDAKATSANSKLDAVIDSLALILDTELSLEAIASEIETQATQAKNETILIKTEAVAINTNLVSTNLKLDSVIVSNDLIATNTAGLLKTTDLNLDGSKNLSVIATNMPTNFPDAASLSELNNIKNYLNLISSGLDVNMTSPIPAGANNIGSVSVAESVLPSGAATEMSLLEVRDNAFGINNGVADLGDTLDRVAINSDAILEAILTNKKPRRKIFEKDIDISENAILRLLDDVIDIDKIEELSTFQRYDIQVFGYSNPISFQIREETSMDGVSFYHVVLDKSVSVSGLVTFAYRLPIRNLSVKFTANANTITSTVGVSKAKVIIYAQDE